MANSNLFSTLLLSVAALGLITSCTASSSDLAGSSGVSGTSFVGCTTGAGLTNTSIEINFEFPDTVDKIVVSRNGVEIGSSTSAGTTSVIDTGLIEGTTYHYTCDGSRGARKITGTNALDLSPVNTNAPVFAGIKAVAASTSSSGTVSWNPESAGPKMAYLKIYGNIGTTLNWNATPLKVFSTKGVFQTDVVSLGDEIPYSFGVRACTSADICDNNTVVKTLTLPDAGAPKTVGATAVTATNYIASITAPWSDAKGGIAERRIYQCMGTGCTLGTTASKVVAVTDITNPPTLLTVENLNEYVSYSFKVLDVDPSGNISSNNSIITIQTGDLSAPSFAGITSVALNTSAPDTKVDISFLALPREGTADVSASTGASTYLLYVTSALFPGAPTSACSATTPQTVVSASLYAPGMASYTMMNLTPRTNYSFCLKARDAAGNISTNTVASSLTTSDITPPTFGGIQSISYNQTTKKIQLSWNTASATDLRIYRVKMWSNTATPSSGAITTFNLAASTDPSGHSFSLADYPAVGLDQIYAVVDACDNALDLNISGQGDNCTAYAVSSAKSLTMPDITPPQNFPGIKPEAYQSTTVQGQAVITWYPATTWSSDYQGFKVYSVDATNSNALTLLKTCVCAVPGACNNSDVSCTLTGLSPSRTYRFHVRAFDLAGNETDYLNPGTNYADLKIKDSTAPTFNSGLSISLMTLSWTAATDNQYAETGNVITYQIWRKTSSTFASAAAPYADGTLVKSQTGTTYAEDSVTAGGTFYYSLCAVDAQNNRTCDGNVKSMVVTDAQKPVILTFTDTKTSDDIKKWNVTWTLSDNVSANSNIRLRIYRKYGTASTVVATTSDEKILDSYGDGTLTGLTGPLNVNNYISFLVWAQDEAGNITTLNRTFYSANAITIDSVTAASGSTSGGRILLIKGSGFSYGTANGYGTNTAVKLGTLNCLNSVILSNKQMSCVTPAASEAVVNVVVANPEGSSATLTSGYTYVAASSDICDNPTSWGTYFAKGAGSGSNPYIICNRTHLNNAINSSYGTVGYTFKLGDNIDLSSNPLSSTQDFTGTIDGGGFAIMNNTLVGASTLQRVYFMSLNGAQSAVIKNLNLLNFNIQNTYPTVANSNYQLSSSIFALKMNLGSASFDNVTLTSTLTGLSGINIYAAPFTSYSQWDSNNAYNLTITNSDFNTQASGGLQSFSGVISGFDQWGSYVTTPTVAISNSKIKGSASTDYQAIRAAGIAGDLGFNRQMTLNVTTSDVSLTVRKSTTVATDSQVAGIVNMASNITVSKTKVFLDILGFTQGNFGGLLNTTVLSGSNVAYTKSVAVSDTYVTGNILAVGGVRGTFASNLYYDAPSGSGMSFNRVWGAASIYSSGTRFASAALASNNAGTLAGYTPSGTGNFYNMDLLSSGTASYTGYSVMPVTALATSDMQNQATGNAYLTYGYDFTPVTGTWKWCSAGDYPHLMWETCP